MKKLYLLLGLVSSHAFSQDSQRSIAGNTTINLQLATTNIKPDESSQANVLLNKNGVYVKAYLNNIPSAVLADFIHKYDGAENVKWKIDENEVTGNFYFNNEKVAVTYKKNGHLVYTRKNYDSTKLTRGMKIFLQAELNKDFRIELITEVIGENTNLYEINLANQLQICVVRLMKNKDGELELTEKFFYRKVPTENL